MAGVSRYDDAKLSEPFNVATAEKGSSFYGNCEPVSQR